ncbi:MAG TPA: hypothetical protein VGR37_08400 [Longimicrobiaceae bacterium]|nr:hypothetical protein [Longimicrobiaceae bacterium]
MKKTLALLALLAPLAPALPAAAQAAAARPLSFEARGGATLPAGEFADGVGSGFTVGGSVGYLFSTYGGWGTSVYAGFTYNAFSVDDETGLLRDVRYQLPGFDAGLRTALPATLGGEPFVRGGLVFYKGDLADDPDAIRHDWELGLDGAAGFEYPRGARFTVTPALGYTWVPGQGIGDAAFLKLDVGLRVRL